MSLNSIKKSSIFILLLFIGSQLFANNPKYTKIIKPTFILTSKGLVNDFAFDHGKLYVANDEGSVEVFDLANQKKVDEIFIDPLLTTKQVWQNSKILSVDRHNGKTLIVSTNTTLYRDVWIHDGKELKHIIKPKDKLSIDQYKVKN